MSLEEIIQVLKFIFGGNDIVASIAKNPRVMLPVFAVALLGIAGSLVRHRLYGTGATAFGLATMLAAAFWLVPAAKDVPGVSSGSEVAFTVFPGQSLIGGDPASARTTKSSFDDCRRFCGSDRGCVAFTYDKAQRACFPKAYFTTMHPFADADSGVKKAQPAPATR